MLYYYSNIISNNSKNIMGTFKAKEFKMKELVGISSKNI